jgi:peptide/nickel transport system substrate-binding protein
MLLNRFRRPGTNRTIGLLVAMVGLIASACATTNEDNKSAAAKQELVVAAPEDTSVLHPAPEANVATGYGNANAPVFETLVSMAPDFTIHPLLATSWRFIPPNTWQFKLRRGVKFQNGEPFDAKAVAYTVNELWAKQSSNILSVGAHSAKVVDRYAVDITPTQTNHALLGQLVHPENAIQAPGTYAGVGTKPSNTPTGTGPFKFERYDKGKQLIVERWDGYWGPKPRLTQITFRFIPDDNARVLALKAGEVDAIYDVPRDQASALDNDPDIKIVRSGVGAYDALLLNHHGSPPYDILRDLRVRKAIAYGVDKQTIVKNVWQGNAEVMQTVIPAPVLGPFADMVKGYPYDPAKSKELLDQAGWKPGPGGIRTKDGRPLRLSLWVVDPDEQRPMPELVKAELKDVGIDVQINAPGDANLYFDRIGKAAGDMFAEVGNQNDANPIFLGALFTARPGGFSDYAVPFGAGPAYDRAFSRAIASHDVGEVRRLAAEAMHIAVDEVVAAVPIAGIFRIWGLSKEVAGFVPHPSEVNQKWNDVYLRG